MEPRAPEIEDGNARAWKLDARGETVGAWLVELTASVGGSVTVYLVTVTHLREVEGRPAPRKWYAAASHELMVWRTTAPSAAAVLTDSAIELVPPPIAVEQVHGLTDEEASIFAQATAFQLVHLLLPRWASEKWRAFAQEYSAAVRDR